MSEIPGIENKLENTKGLDHTKTWMLLSERIYNESFIDELSERIKSLTSQRSILEYGCGDAHVLAGLAERGFTPCLGIDSDKAMVDKARQNIGLGVEIEQSDWRTASGNRQYGVVMCRGGSLMYIDTWNQGKDAQTSNREEREESVRDTLRNMWERTMSGGLLYVDVTSKGEIIAGIKETKFEMDDIVASGSVHCDIENKIRTVTGEGFIGADKIAFNAVSHLYTRDDAVKDLLSLGIVEDTIIFPTINSETLFDVACVKKD